MHLLLASKHIKASESAEGYAQHISQLHHDISPHIHLSSEANAHSTNFHIQFKESQEWDLVMAHLQYEKFPPNDVTKLPKHGTGPFQILKHIGSNISDYPLDCLLDWGISTTFNISDLKPYHSPSNILHNENLFAPPSPHPPNYSITCSPHISSPSQGIIAMIMDSPTISMGTSKVQQYMVRWTRCSSLHVHINLVAS